MQMDQHTHILTQLFYSKEDTENHKFSVACEDKQEYFNTSNYLKQQIWHKPDYLL